MSMKVLKENRPKACMKKLFSMQAYSHLVMFDPARTRLCHPSKLLEAAMLLLLDILRHVKESLERASRLSCLKVSLERARFLSYLIEWVERVGLRQFGRESGAGVGLRQLGRESGAGVGL
jgi:hypothetical protein